MRLGQVIGTVVATQKSTKLKGTKLMLVALFSSGSEPLGPVVLAVDTVQAGIGETVLLVIDGRAAVSALRRRRAPVDAAIIGIVDYVDHVEQS